MCHYLSLVTQCLLSFILSFLINPLSTFVSLCLCDADVWWWQWIAPHGGFSLPICPYPLPPPYLFLTSPSCVLSSLLSHGVLCEPLPFPSVFTPAPLSSPLLLASLLPSPLQRCGPLFPRLPLSSLYPLVINKAEVNNDLVAISLFPCVLIFFGWSRRCWLKGHIPLKCKYTLPNHAVGNLYLSTYPTCNIVWECVLTPLLALANVHLFNCHLFNGQMSAFPWFLVKLNIFSYHYQTLIFILLWIAVWRHT